MNNFVAIAFRKWMARFDEFGETALMNDVSRGARVGLDFDEIGVQTIGLQQLAKLRDLALTNRRQPPNFGAEIMGDAGGVNSFAARRHAQIRGGDAVRMAAREIGDA